MAPGTPHASRNKMHLQAVRPNPYRRPTMARPSVAIKRSGRNGRIAAALAGGAVAGPVGAAGAYLAAKQLSKKKKKKQKAQKMILR